MKGRVREREGWEGRKRVGDGWYRTVEFGVGGGCEVWD